MIQGIPPSSDRLLAAYQAWLNLPDLTASPYDGVKGECRQRLAQAMRMPGRPEPQDAEQRAMRILLDHEADTYVRHGPEETRLVDYHPERDFPPLDSRYNIGSAVQAPNSTWYAVDLDRQPFRAFVEHEVELGLGPPWVYTVGLVPLRIFARYTGELYHPADRDHYYASSRIPTRHWVFLYRDPDEHSEDPDAVRKTQQTMKRQGVPRIHWDDYQLLWTIWHNWHNIYAARKFLKA